MLQVNQGLHKWAPDQDITKDRSYKCITQPQFRLQFVEPDTMIFGSQGNQWLHIHVKVEQMQYPVGRKASSYEWYY